VETKDMLDLNDVALFVQVVRAGSFAEAARRAGIPSNSASRRVQQLEEELGLRLLHRSTRRLTLTDAGEAFYARCANEVEALSAAAAELSEGSQIPSGKVRVAAASDFFNWFQMDWVTEFLAAHPKVRLEFVLNDARADLVAEGIDVALRAGKVTEPTFVARRLGSNRASMVASPSYLAQRGTPESLDDLASHDCLALPPTMGRTIWHLDGPEGPAEVQVSGRFYANAAHVLLKASLAGLGITLLPEMMISAPLRSAQLVEVLPDYCEKGLDIYLVYLNRRQLPRAVSEFIEYAMTKIVEAGLISQVGPEPPRIQ
jgi:DNA-binding transcriptional LysR family regulator